MAGRAQRSAAPTQPSLLPKKVFGWGEKKSDMAEGMDYTEFLAGGESIAGGMEMNSMVPPQVPSYWQVPTSSIRDLCHRSTRGLSRPAFWPECLRLLTPTCGVR